MSKRPLLWLACGVLTSVVGCTGNATVSVRASSDAPPPAPTSVPVEAPPVAAPTESTVTIFRPVDKVGDKYVERATRSHSLVFRAGSSAFETELVRTHVEEDTTEVLAVANGTETKIRVTFAEEGEQRIHNGHWKRIASGVAGKTYVVERRDGRLVVTTDKGKAPPKKELHYVERRFANLGRDAGYRAAFGEPLRVGAQVPALASFFRDVFTRGTADRVQADGITVTLTGTRQVEGEACGVFALVVPVVVELKSELGHELDETELRGELVVRARDGLPLSIVLDGPARVRVDANGLTVLGEGTARFTSVVRTP